MRPIEAEMRRRALVGSLEPKLSKEAQALHAWAKRHIDPSKQIPTPRAIENALRGVYREKRRSRQDA